MKSVKLTHNEVLRFKNYTKDLRHENPHQYEDVRIKDNDIVLILYNSKKLVYNENENTLSILNKILEEKEYMPYAESSDENYEISLSDYQFTIGSDETGKGEWYGPLVITATCTSRDENIKLRDIGVKDSKKLSNKQIQNLYKKITDMGITHKTIILKPFSYNSLYDKFKSQGKNLNHLLAYLHSKAIDELVNELSTDDVLVIIDKFDYKKMNEYLDLKDTIKVIQESDGERYIPVAVSSIIAKYNYEKTLNHLEKRYNIRLRKTKPRDIDKNIIDKVAKMHFKNVPNKK